MEGLSANMWRRLCNQMLGVDARQPVVCSCQHVVEGAGGDRSCCVGRVRSLCVPEAPPSPGTAPPIRKGKLTQATLFVG